MSRLSAALLLGGLAAVIVCSPSQASPYVGTVDTAHAVVRLVGADGAGYSLALQVQVSAPVAGPVDRVLAVQVSRCAKGRCSVVAAYRSPLGPNEVTVASDDSFWNVRTNFMGSRLAASWAADGSSDTGPSANATVTGPQLELSAGTGESPRAVAVELLGASCRVDGSTSRQHILAVEGSAQQRESAPPPRPIAPFVSRSAHQVRCVA